MPDFHMYLFIALQFVYRKTNMYEIPIDTVKQTKIDIIYTRTVSLLGHAFIFMTANYY